MPLLTSRLILRFFTFADFQSMRRLDSDPKVLYYRSRSSISAEETQAFLELAQSALQEFPRRFYAYAIMRRADNVFLGQCGMTAITVGAEECALWYSLLPEYWGQGYMTEAVSGLIWLGFTQFGLQNIIAGSHPDNLASIRVMEKVGLHSLGSFWPPSPQPASEANQRGRRVVSDGQKEPHIRIRYGLKAVEFSPDATRGVEILPPV